MRLARNEQRLGIARHFTRSLRRRAGETRNESARDRAAYFFFGFAGAPAANGFGGSAAPRAAAEPAPLAFPFAFAAGAGGGSATGALATEAGSTAGGAMTTGATSGVAGAMVAAALVAAADAVAFERGGSSEAPAMIRTTVATNTHAATRPRPRRTLMFGFGAKSGIDMRDMFIGRGGGTDSGA